MAKRYSTNWTVMAEHTHGLRLIRDDCGSGGWSLHHPADEDADGMANRILLEDDSEWDEAADDWARPNQADYDAAHAQRFSPPR